MSRVKARTLISQNDIVSTTDQAKWLVYISEMRVQAYETKQGGMRGKEYPIMNTEQVWEVTGKFKFMNTEQVSGEMEES